MVLAPGAWMQRRDKQVILIQCNTFSELHRVPDTMVYNHNNPRWWGGGLSESALRKFEPRGGAAAQPACGSNCRLDKGEARGSQRVPGFQTGPCRDQTRAQAHNHARVAPLLPFPISSPSNPVPSPSLQGPL